MSTQPSAQARTGLPSIAPALLEVVRRTAEVDALSKTWGLSEANRRRQVSEQVAAELPMPPRPDVQSRDLYAVLPGREIAMRLYTPGKAARPPKLMPYIHGGGWVVGSIATHDTLCQELAVETGYAVASIQYRRAPEHPYPDQQADIWDAVMWLRDHALALGVDAQSPMALGGDSAGAHLALGCAQRMQREAPGLLDRLLLFYPALDPTLASASAHEYAGGPGLTRAAMVYYWDALLKGASSRDAALLFEATPEEMPATVLVTAEVDLLRDEGEKYAHRLAQAGVPVSAWRAEGMIHGFARMYTVSEAARAHVRRACRDLLSLRTM